jgi:hypothetical protein
MDDPVQCDRCAVDRRSSLGQRLLEVDEHGRLPVAGLRLFGTPEVVPELGSGVLEADIVVFR